MSTVSALESRMKGGIRQHNPSKICEAESRHQGVLTKDQLFPIHMFLVSLMTLMPSEDAEVSCCCLQR